MQVDPRHKSPGHGCEGPGLRWKTDPAEMHDLLAKCRRSHCMQCVCRHMSEEPTHGQVLVQSMPTFRSRYRATTSASPRAPCRNNCNACRTQLKSELAA